MLKFCANRGREHEQRGFFCGNDCERQFHNRKRSERAEEKCRTCGRRYRKSRVKTSVLIERNAPELDTPLQ